MTARRLAAPLIAAALVLIGAFVTALPSRLAPSSAAPFGAGGLLSAFVTSFGAPSAQAGGDEGRYDHLLFVLSWSPSYCETKVDADSVGNTTGPIDEQCTTAGRRFGFIVHGLWPQYARGWPEYCAIPPPKLDPKLVESMLPLMPSRQLIRHEWEKHGTCTGLLPVDYFELVRQVRRLVRIPPRLQELFVPAMVSPAVIERMFREENPGLKADEIAITCEKRRLREVRICFDRDLNFRACSAAEKRACRSDWVLMPPVKTPGWP